MSRIWEILEGMKGGENTILKKNDRFIYCAAFGYTRAANLLFFQTVFALFLWGGPKFYWGVSSSSIQYFVGGWKQNINKYFCISWKTLMPKMNIAFS